MINKKAQGEIITTVLIILLVLAAVVIVWQVVNSTISKGSEDVKNKGDCLGAALTITNIDITAKNITVRNDAGKSINDFKIYIKGSLASITAGNGSMEAGSTRIATVSDTIVAKDKVEAAAIISGNICPVYAEKIA